MENEKKTMINFGDNDGMFSLEEMAEGVAISRDVSTISQEELLELK